MATKRQEPKSKQAKETTKTVKGSKYYGVSLQRDVTKTEDSTSHFRNKVAKAYKAKDSLIKDIAKKFSTGQPTSSSVKKLNEVSAKHSQAMRNQVRQGNKGRIGYDKNGYPLKSAKKSIIKTGFH